MPYVRTRLGRGFSEEHGWASAAGGPRVVLLDGLAFDGRGAAPTAA